jgi:tetratricopeptide (TPR) repeat protein
LAEHEYKSVNGYKLYKSSPNLAKTNMGKMMHLSKENFVSIVALTNKAKIELERKSYINALDFYKKAENIFPKPVEKYTGACFLFYSMAGLLLLMKNEQAAAQYLTRATKCLDGVNDAKIWYQLGLMHFSKNNTEQAIAYFRKAFSISKEEVFISTDQQEIDFFETYIFGGI